MDWAFYQNGRPIFLVEAKDAGTKLGGYDEQLGDYFAKEPDVKLGILTNGVMWRFFTDIINANVMDKEPFVKWDVLNDEQPPYDFLTLLQKSQFKTELVRTFAQRQHEHNLLVNELARLLEPSAEFTRLAIANIETRNLTASVVESWKPVVASAIGEWAKQRTLASVLTRSPSQITANRPTEPETSYASGPVTQGAGRKRSRVDLGVTLPDLIAAGILTPPLKLFRKYKGQPLEADPPAGRQVEFQGSQLRHLLRSGRSCPRVVTGRAYEHERLGLLAVPRRWRETPPPGRREEAGSPSPRGGQQESSDRQGAARASRSAEEVLASPPQPSQGEGHPARRTSPRASSAGSRPVPACGASPSSTPSTKKRAGSNCTSTGGRERRQRTRTSSTGFTGTRARSKRAFGGPLSWQRLDDKQGCRIAYTTTAGGYRSDESKWPAIQDAMIDAMARLEQALTPHLEKLKTELRA